jgi:hypothetical protein
MRYLLILCLVGCASRKVDHGVIHAIAKETKSKTTQTTQVSSSSLTKTRFVIMENVK